MKTLTPSEALDFVLTHGNNPQPISFIALTPVPAKKGGNDLPGPLFKLARYRAFIGDFERSVNAQLAREGKDQLHFTAKPRAWGHHLNRAVVEHQLKDGTIRHYLSVQVLKPTNPLYLVETLREHLRARRRRLVGIAKEEIAHLLPKVSEPTNQATDRHVIHRDVCFDHVVLMAMAGERFRISGRLHTL